MRVMFVVVKITFKTDKKAHFVCIVETESNNTNRLYVINIIYIMLLHTSKHTATIKSMWIVCTLNKQTNKFHSISNKINSTYAIKSHFSLIAIGFLSSIRYIHMQIGTLYKLQIIPLKGNLFAYNSFNHLKS